MTQQKTSYTEKEVASTQTPGELLTQELAADYADPLGFVLMADPRKQLGTELEHEQCPDENQKQFLIDLGKEVAGRAFNGTDPVMPILMINAEALTDFLKRIGTTAEEWNRE